MYEASTAGKVAETPSLISTPMATILGPEYSTSIVDSVGLFENEMFMSAMHGGYAGGKTSAFKRVADPRHIIAYACSLPREPMEHGLIIVVTGDSCAGKADDFNDYGKTTRVVSISDAIMRQFAAATGADLRRLLSMRDQAPVTTLGHLVPNSRLVDVRVKPELIIQLRQRFSTGIEDCNGSQEEPSKLTAELLPARGDCDYRPNLSFYHDTAGDDAARSFAGKRLLPLIRADLRRLIDMVRVIPDLPCPGIEFRNILNIAQMPGGLALCTTLLQSHFTGTWSKVDAIVSCEAGGFIFASALALQVGLMLVPIREAGKLPPPVVSFARPVSHISSGVNGASVVVVDDVFTSGETMCAILKLLKEVGLGAEQISVMTVAEFPLIWCSLQAV
ncbi:phosphoribosyltransferase-like protein [Colletotrichum godetiae]|uniref:adenine phosphoribosyltransferase n=1 Tax=Colletotrichum godetiae TaxID=1209918 RepID=A0AAJ0ESR6_9PEZI|nr:phosphoribosyltransferase-like protein [Colletotrichum godetiae]KAK1675351.1 phosphoribosyltransferase-like protein [Colletotrichum godetiae]